MSFRWSIKRIDRALEIPFFKGKRKKIFKTSVNMVDDVKRRLI